MLIELRRGKVSNRLLMVDAIKLTGRLLDEGRYDDADRIHLAVVDGVAGSKPASLRHRYRLIRSAIRGGEFDRAYALLRDHGRVLAIAARAAGKSDGWVNTWLGETHLHEVAWGEYYRAIGAVERSHEYLSRARTALLPFLEDLGENQYRIFQRQFTHAEFEADVLFAAGRYRSALESLDGWLDVFEGASGEFAGRAERNLIQLRRLRASALQLLASKGEEDPDVARDALMQSLDAARDDDLARLDLLYSLVKLELDLGRPEAARALVVEAPAVDLPPEATCLRVALRLACAEEAVRDALTSELQAAIDVLVTEWLTAKPRAGGRGWLHYNKVRFVLNALLRSRLGVPATSDWEVVRGQPAARALDCFLPVLAVNDLARRMGAPPLQATSELQSTLLPGEAGLLLNPGQLPGVGFLVTRSEVAAFPIAPREECKKGLATLRGITSADYAARWDGVASVEAWDEASLVVSEAFFPEAILKQLAASDAVIFFARGLSLSLPLEAVRVDGEALCLRCTISDVPTPGVLAHLRGVSSDRSPKDSGDAGASGAPVIVANVPDASWSDPLGSSAEGLASIRLSEGLLSAWADSLGRSTRVVQGAAGCIEAFREGLFTGSCLGVAYVHGTSIDDPERPSAMLVGSRSTAQPEGKPSSVDHGRLGSAEVEALAVPEVMVLAACGTARAPQRVGAWGSNHLGGAFMLAGARSVIVSAGDLPAEPTARLVGDMLGPLGRRDSVGDALLQARRGIAGAGSQVPASHYVLPILFGLPEVSVCGVEGPARQRRYGLFIVGGILALAAIFVVSRSAKAS